MQKESKELAWVSVVLLNVITGLLIFMDGSYVITQFFDNPLDFFGEYYLVFVASLCITVIPTLVSYIKSDWRKYIGYGVPIISLVAIAGGFIQSHTCTGKMCGLLGFLIMIIAFGVGVLFLLSFLVAQYAAPKKNIWMYIVLALELIAIAWISTQIGNPDFYF
jgi:hypothetical protein